MPPRGHFLPPCRRLICRIQVLSHPILIFGSFHAIFFRFLFSVGGAKGVSMGEWHGMWYMQLNAICDMRYAISSVPVSSLSLSGELLLSVDLSYAVLLYTPSGAVRFDGYAPPRRSGIDRGTPCLSLSVSAREERANSPSELSSLVRTVESLYWFND